MAMDVGAAQTGKQGTPRPEMNVTPLVDVVLVLLIIFMVLTAMMNDHFWVHVPEKDQKDQQNIEEQASDDEAPIVVTRQPQRPDPDQPGRLSRQRVPRAPQAHAGRARRAAHLLRRAGRRLVRACHAGPRSRARRRRGAHRRGHREVAGLSARDSASRRTFRNETVTTVSSQRRGRNELGAATDSRCPLGPERRQRGAGIPFDAPEDFKLQTLLLLVAVCAPVPALTAAQLGTGDPVTPSTAEPAAPDPRRWPESGKGTPDRRRQAAGQAQGRRAQPSAARCRRERRAGARRRRRAAPDGAVLPAPDGAVLAGPTAASCPGPTAAARAPGDGGAAAQAEDPFAAKPLEPGADRHTGIRGRILDAQDRAAAAARRPSSRAARTTRPAPP